MSIQDAKFPTRPTHLPRGIVNHPEQLLAWQLGFFLGRSIGRFLGHGGGVEGE